MDARKRWKLANPEKHREHTRRAYKKLRDGALTAYGGDPPKCACCGEDTYEFLSLDHIENNGKEQREKHGGSREELRWLRNEGYPDGYQVLCHNCNLAKGFYGACPHTTR